MAAEQAAREALLSHDIEPTALVLTVAFNDGACEFCVASQIPASRPAFLASSLHESAVQAGWSALDDWGTE